MKPIQSKLISYTFILILSWAIPATIFAGGLIPANVPIATDWDPCISSNSSNCTPQTPSRVSDQCRHNLSQAEQNEGFELLFDGTAQSLNQNWEIYQSPNIYGWNIKNGCLNLHERGVTAFRKTRDIMTKKDYSNFELRLEWKVRFAGNSGIFVREAPFRRGGNFTDGNRSAKNFGYEMQILHFAHYDWGFDNGRHKAGAVYGITNPSYGDKRPHYRWRKVRIVANGPNYQFFLDNRLTGEFEVGTDAWKRLMQANSVSTSGPDYTYYGTRSSGRIMFQDHWDNVSFRNIRIKELPDTPAFPVVPFK